MGAKSDRIEAFTIVEQQSAMSDEQIEGGPPVAWRLASAAQEPMAEELPEQLFQTTPLDLSVPGRRCSPEQEMHITGSGSTSAFKKSMLKRYSKSAIIVVY